MRKTAFTLVELLVVVTIIALLLVLLMPSMKSAIYTSRVTTCASNQRQIAAAVLAYTSDNFGVLPSYSGNSNPTSYSDSHANRMAIFGWEACKYLPSSGRAVNPYLGNDPKQIVALCPLDEGWQAGFNSSYVGTFYNVYGTSYRYNSNLSWGNQPVLRDRSLSSIQRTGRLVMITDFTVYWADEGYWYTRMHNLKGKPDVGSYTASMRFDVNMAFIDGHVATAEIPNTLVVAKRLTTSAYSLQLE